MKYALLGLGLALLSAGSWSQELPFSLPYLQAGGFGCHACHGVYADGGMQVGGNIRGASLADLERSLHEQPTMRALAAALDATSKASIVDYLQQLAELPLLRLHLGQEHWQQEPVVAGQWMQILVYNAELQPVVLDLSDLGLEKVTLRARAEHSFVWQAQTGSYQLGTYQLEIP